MSRKWKNTSGHWTKQPNADEIKKRVAAGNWINKENAEEIRQKVIKNLQPNGYKGEYTEERMGKLQTGREKYMKENKNTEEYRQSRTKATRHALGNKYAYKNGNATDPIKFKLASQRNGRIQQLKRYGLTIEKYNQMFVDQNGGCAICKEQPKNGNNLCVDHCHTTGRVRGLLCSGCNLGLGRLKDSVELLKSAISYLSRP